MAGTGALNASSQLVRNKWVREGLIQKASRSFWAPYTGKTADSIIYQVNDASKEAGHQIRFDFSGNLTQRARKNKETAVGTGEVKRKFSDLITVDRYRQVVDNGDKFTGSTLAISLSTSIPIPGQSLPIFGFASKTKACSMPPRV